MLKVLGNEVKNEVSSKGKNYLNIISTKVKNYSIHSKQHLQHAGKFQQSTKDSELVKHPKLKKLVNLCAFTCKIMYCF